MKRRKFKNENGFEDHGGYMAMKISKLEEQFVEDAGKNIFKKSDLFKGISIFVNGYTTPSADELKRIMMAHGGIYHTYQRSTTTFTIASNLPDVKIRQLTTEKVIHPQWVVDSLKANKILDYSKYLLYTNYKPTQPKIMFPKSSKEEMKNKKYEISKDDLKNILSKINILNSEMQNSNTCIPVAVKAEAKVVEKNPVIEVSECNAKKEEKGIVDVTFSDEDSDLHFDDENYEQYSMSMSPIDYKLSPVSPEKNINKEESSPEMEDLCLYSSDDDVIPEVIVPHDAKIQPVANDYVEEESSVISEEEFDESKSVAATENTTVEVKPSTKPKSRTAVDPNFLSEFFNNSRLHHIATLGAGFKQYINELRAKHNGEFPDRDNLRHLAAVGHTHDTAERFVMHIDMDCFFVSVGLRKYPHLRGQPVAVTHSKDGKTSMHRPGVDRVTEINMYRKRMEDKYSTDTETHFETQCKLYNVDANNSMAEIASCSYEARKMGVKNGMFVGSALKLCPNLKTMPYDFEGYKEVAFTLYNTIAKYTMNIEAVSCDEMFVDLSSLLTDTKVNCMVFVSHLRKEIKELTKCPCSAGVGANKLQARLATKRAKPDGQFHLEADAVEQYMKTIEISELPGVGRSTNYRLGKMNWKFCGDIQHLPLSTMQKEFGNKFGEKLHKFCRGEDDSELVFDKTRKSVSAEVNYGIRFKEDAEVETFMRQLCAEVHNRLKEINKKGKCITLKLMVRAKDAPLETAKFMGHGLCDYINKSVSLSTFTCDLKVITKYVLNLLKSQSIKPDELRGIGIQISKLEEPTEKHNSNLLINMFKNVVNRKVEQSTGNNTNCQPSSSKTETCNKTPQTPVKNKTSPAPPVSPRSRGRPRKNQATTSSSNVSKMFNDMVARKKYEMDIDCNFDPEVLAALPADIREEAIRDYRKHQMKNKMLEERETAPAKEKIQVDAKFLEILPTQLREDVQKQISLQADKVVVIDEKPPVLESVSPINTVIRTQHQLSNDNIFKQKEWRTLLCSWIVSCGAPEEFDVNMLAQSACEYIKAKMLPDIFIGLKYLHRIIEEKNNICPWHLAYQNIVDLVQIEMLNVYRSKLHVPLIFNNCNCTIYRNNL